MLVFWLKATAQQLTTYMTTPLLVEVAVQQHQEHQLTVGLGCAQGTKAK